MRIHWSDEAIKAALAHFPANTVWKLVYDSEGCGCAVSGVPALWAIDAPADDELPIASNAFTVWIEQRHVVFFEESMRISYVSDTKSFKLSSDNQIYTSRLPLQNKQSA